MRRQAIGGSILLLAACAPLDTISFDPSVGEEDVLFAILADVMRLEAGLDLAKDIKVVRPRTEVFRVEDAGDLFMVSQSAPLDIKEGDLRVARGPWLRLDEFEHTCQVATGGQCLPKELPEVLGSLSLVDACPDDQRVFAFRPGCLDTEGDDTGRTHACSGKANILPPQGPDAPALPADVLPPEVTEPPIADACGTQGVPDQNTGRCVRLFADCLVGPFANGGTDPLYIDDDAPVGGDGTLARPLRDLSSAAATGRDLLLAAGTYILPAPAGVQSSWRSLCPDQTTIEGDLLVIDGQIAGTSVVGNVTLSGSSTIANAAVVGSLRVTAGAYATVESVVVDGRSQDVAAVVSSGTVDGRHLSIHSGLQPAFRINAGVTTLDGLFVGTSTRGVVVRNLGSAFLANSWIQSQGDAITSDGEARLSINGLVVNSEASGLIGQDNASLNVAKAWFNVRGRGIVSHTSQGSGRQINLQDVVVNLIVPSTAGVLVEGGRLNSERTAVFGVADTSYRIRYAREALVKDLTVVNPGYLGEPERNPLDPTTERPQRHGTGLHWLSHIDDDQARLEAERVHLTGVPGGSILAVRESQDSDATTVATATFKDITIVGEEPWRVGPFTMQALTAEIDRLQMQGVGELSGIRIGDRGTFHLRDINVSSPNQTYSLINSFSLTDSMGVRKQMEVSLHRGYFEGVSDRGLVVLEAHRLDVESVELLSTYVPTRESGDPRAAMRFVGPAEQDATADARFDKISVTTQHPRGLQVEDYDDVIPTVTNILADVADTTIDGIHFEDTSFSLEFARIIGPATRGIGTSRKNEGVTLRFEVKRMRNILVDGAGELFRSPSSPCELPESELCNLASPKKDALILGIPSDVENCTL